MLQSFINRYDTVLLDMDGVITSEEIYWDAAALTVWELLTSARYLGMESVCPAELTARLPEIRSTVFAEDATIKLVKHKGINNNWDLAWLVIAGALSQNTRDFLSIKDWLAALPDVAGGLYAAVSQALQKTGRSEEESRLLGGLWRKVQLCFQEWFLGSRLFPQYWESSSLQEGKSGLTFAEEPIVDKVRLLQLLEALSQTVSLGVGTGRPRVEAENPLRSWGALSYFNPEAFVTYQEMQEAAEALQSVLPGISLTKPHPYVFLRGVFGSRYSDRALAEGCYDREKCAKTLIIGDAGCDLLAAKAAGCDFAAVLTGIEGEAARGYFEENGADYILHNILELLA